MVVMVMSVIVVVMLVLGLVAFLVSNKGFLYLGIIDLALRSVVVSVTVTVVMCMVMVMSMMTVVVIVLVLTSQVVVTVSRVKNLHLNQVEDKTHDCDNKHDISLNLGWLKEAFSCLNQEPARHNPNR